MAEKVRYMCNGKIVDRPCKAGEVAGIPAGTPPAGSAPPAQYLPTRQPGMPTIGAPPTFQSGGAGFTAGPTPGLFHPGQFGGGPAPAQQGFLDRFLGGAKGLAGDFLEKGWEFIKENPEVVLAGLDMYRAARASSKADKNRQRNVDRQEARYAEMAPLRKLQLEKLMAMAASSTPPAKVDLRDRGNPYSR